MQEMKRQGSVAEESAKPSSPNPGLPTGSGSLADYRSRITRFISRLGFLFGLMILLPSLVLELRHGWSSVALAEIVAMASLALLSILGFRVRPVGTVGLVTVVFGLGTFFLLVNGMGDIGAIWLGTSIVLAGILFGATGALVLSCLVSLLFITAIYFVPGALSAGMRPGQLGFLGVTTLGLSLVSSLAAAQLIRYLGQSTTDSDRLGSRLRASESAREEEAAERKGAEALAAFYRDFDALTHLPRRGKLVQAAAAAMRQAERRERLVAVLSIGIDRFSRITDSYGSAASEAFILQVAGSLKASFREDDLVSRLGDDTFCVLCTDLGKSEDVLGLIEKARRCLEAPFNVGGLRLKPIASLGLALYPGDAGDAAGLVHASEAALRRARLSEPGSYCLFDAILNDEVVNRFRLEDELEAALFMGSIVPWFQAKVDSRGRIVGAEALARWELPDGGIRLPDSFIPAAEGSGGIVALGRVILAGACSVAARWSERGLPPIPVSVNLSPFQLRSPSLVEEVREALRNSGLDPARLDLEITESGLAAVEDGAIARLGELKALGVSLSIDDFGTGSSTISRLRDYPVDTVKVPKSFVDPLPSDSRASMVARAVIELAHNLEFEVVAEGVEDQAQFDWLRGEACDQYQGYLFARPMPAGDFEDALARNSAKTVE